MLRINRRRSALIPPVLLALAIAATTLGPAAPVFAQSTEELKHLRDEIEQQKAAMERERKALEQQRRRLDAAIVRLETLEAQQKAPSAPAPVAVVPPPPLPPAAPPVNASSLTIYGFAQVDAIQDFKRTDNDWNATLRPSKIPVVCPGSPGCGNDGETIISAK